MRKENILNARVGKLVSTSYYGKNSSGQLLNCSCDCGQSTVVPVFYFSRGAVTSCGCERNLALEEFLWIRLYRDNVVSTNKVRGFSGENLSFDKFKRLCSAPCFYCGELPSNTKSFRRKEWDNSDFHSVIRVTHVKYNGLDKIDPLGFYKDGNVRPCCPQCNVGKLDESDELLISKFKMFREKWGSNPPEKILDCMKKRMENLHALIKSIK